MSMIEPFASVASPASLPARDNTAPQALSAAPSTPNGTFAALLDTAAKVSGSAQTQCVAGAAVATSGTPAMAVAAPLTFDTPATIPGKSGKPGGKVLPDAGEAHSPDDRPEKDDECSSGTLTPETRLFVNELAALPIAAVPVPFAPAAPLAASSATTSHGGEIAGAPVPALPAPGLPPPLSRTVMTGRSSTAEAARSSPALQVVLAGPSEGLPSTEGRPVTAPHLPQELRALVSTDPATPPHLPKASSAGAAPANAPQDAAPQPEHRKEEAQGPSPVLAHVTARIDAAPVLPSTAPAASVPQVSPPASSAPTTTNSEVATLVDRIAEARAAATPHAIHAALVHQDFGAVSLRFRAEENHIQVTLDNADPGFAPAVQAAAAASLTGGMQGEGDQRERPAPAPLPSQQFQSSAGASSDTTQQQPSRQHPAASEPTAPRQANAPAADAGSTPERQSGGPTRRPGIYA